MPPAYRAQRHFDVVDVVRRIVDVPQTRDPIEEAEQQRIITLQMLEDFEAGDFRAALDSAELLLAWNEGHEIARQIAQDSRTELDAEAANAIGSFDAIPFPRATAAEMEGLDQRTIYVFSHIDGKRTIEEVLDSLVLPSTEGIRVLHWLILYGMVELDVSGR